MDRVKRIWYLSPMRAAKVQASLRIRAVSPEPPLLAHRSSESRGTLRHKARPLAPLNDWACAVKICHDGMLEDTNSLDGAHIILFYCISILAMHHCFLSYKKKWAAIWENQQIAIFVQWKTQISLRPRRITGDHTFKSVTRIHGIPRNRAIRIFLWYANFQALFRLKFQNIV